MSAYCVPSTVPDTFTSLISFKSLIVGIIIPVFSDEELETSQIMIMIFFTCVGPFISNFKVVSDFWRCSVIKKREIIIVYLYYCCQAKGRKKRHMRFLNYGKHSEWRSDTSKLYRIHSVGNKVL